MPESSQPLKSPGSWEVLGPLRQVSRSQVELNDQAHSGRLRWAKTVAMKRRCLHGSLVPVAIITIDNVLLR